MTGSEADIVRRAQTDPSAYGELYRRNADRIYSYIYHRVGNVADAEDLTARTFYRALVCLPAYRDEGLPFSAWLYRIAHNLVANWHRDQSRHEMLPLDAVDAIRFGRDGRGTAAAPVEEVLATAVRRLGPDRQALLILKSQGLSNAEIGAVLGRSEAAVKSLYHRTLETLRDELVADGSLSDEADSHGGEEE